MALFPAGIITVIRRHPCGGRAAGDGWHPPSPQITAFSECTSFTAAPLGHVNCDCYNFQALLRPALHDDRTNNASPMINLNIAQGQETDGRTGSRSPPMHRWTEQCIKAHFTTTIKLKLTTCELHVTTPATGSQSQRTVQSIVLAQPTS